jgi:NADH dehydrogenase
VIEAASAAGVRRLVVLRARDADADRVRELDAAVNGFQGEAILLRTTPVYGLADDAVSLMLVMMRSLPAVPVLGEHRPMQPVWHEDVAAAVAAAAVLPMSEAMLALDIAGREVISQEDLFDHISRLIDRRPLKVPIPDFLAAHGAWLADALGITGAVPMSRLAFHTGSGAAVEEAGNALSRVLDVTPTPLDQGLRRLIQDLEELPLAEGVGSLEMKRFAAHIPETPHDAASLMRAFRRRFKDMMPIDVGVEPAAPDVTLETGAVLTMAMPGRGHVQVRVEDADDRHVVLATLRGHALAGVVRFRTQDFETGVRFEVLTCDAAGNAFDWVGLTLLGARLQDANWRRVVRNVVQLAGGREQDVQMEGHKLSHAEAAEAQAWVQRLIDARRSAEITPDHAQGYAEQG